jgi:uncharacterized delta-60 repeat protein
MVRDPEGNVYLAGDGDAAGAYYATVVKLDANGQLVPSFGNGGKATINIGNPADEVIRALARDGAGNLYVAGDDGDAAGNYAFTVIKLDANGYPVTSFGNGGKALVAMGPGSDDYGNAVAVDGIGNVYVAGSSNAPGSVQMAIAKLDASGHLVVGFGAGGRTFVGIGGSGYADSANAIALDGNGHLFLGGDTTDDPDLLADMVVVELDSTGNPIADFGTAGIARIHIADRNFGTALALARDGSRNVYLAGNTTNFIIDSEMAVVRLDASGNPFVAQLPHVGDNGNGNDSRDYATSVVLDGGGDIYVGGYTNATSGFPHFVAAEIDASRNMVTDFGNGGFAQVDVVEQALASVLDDHGLTLAGFGFSADGNYDYIAARLLVTLPDRIFANGFE